MAQDQLEIIASNGDIEFYNLNPAKGLTNIGRHPENDIVIDDPNVAPFHAMLDHRQRPYQFVLLSQDGQTSLRGELLYPNGGVPLQNLDTIGLGSYTLILMESQNGHQTTGSMAPQAPIGMSPRPSTSGVQAPTESYRPPTPPPSPPTAPVPAPARPTPSLPARPAAIPPPATRPEPTSHTGFTASQPPPSPPPTTPVAPAASPSLSSNGVVGFYKTLPPDQPDDVILTQISEREATVNVEQTAAFEVTITNGGPLVASFNVAVDGIDERWVTVSEPLVNLYEGGRTSVVVTVTPPRLPSSWAGLHYFAIVVTSSDYYDHYSQHGVALEILPYHDFSIGELSPKQQTISWFTRSGKTGLTITNKGNGDTPFRVTGADDERACSFEFQMPGEQVAQASQAELRLPPEHVATIPIQITPHSRRLFGFRKRTYSFTISTTPLVGEQTPRSQLGQLGHKPLFGLLTMLLLLLLLLILIIYFFRPTISFFSAEPKTVQAGEEVVLRWQGSPFANLQITGGPGAGVVENNIGERAVVPEENTTYVLRADNWVSWLLSFLSSRREQTVEVIPVNPVIRVFQADKQEIFTNEEVLLSWDVAAADDVILTSNGVPETLAPTEHTGQRTITPEESATFTLTAVNRFGEVIENVEIRVDRPPIPTPLVRSFTVNPQVIVAGESVVLDWEVEGAEVVQLSPIGDVPPVQSLSRKPPQSLEYVLVASNGEARSQPIIRQVEVNTPTPGPTATAEPVAPVIEFFTASPDELIKGEEETVDLAWSVVGETTNIEISGPSIGVVSGLSPQGSLSVTEEEATLFILTAFNDSLNASQTLQISDEDPTPTPEPTEPPPPPTATPLPPNIIFFSAAPADPDDDDKVTFESDDPPTYEVVAGTKINLSWEIQNATQASLSVNGSSLGDQALTGLLPRTVTSDETYLLTASNDQEGIPPDTAQLQINAVQQIPPPPFNVIGTEAMTNAIQIEWQYNNQDENDIEGFRLYRADIPPGTKFDRVADIDVLESGTRDWNDTDLTETCGKSYYVVAAYIDFEGNLLETDASANSWLSPPCP